MLLFRALNDYDILLDPLSNGIPSKELLFMMTKNYLFSKEKEHMMSLSKEKQDEYIKAYIPTYIITHKHKMKKMIDRYLTRTKNNLSGIETLNSDSWAKLLIYLSTINNHLVNGSKTFTPWISTSKDFNRLKPYYQNQTVHKIAVIGTVSEGLLDENTIAVDLSTKDKIKDLIPVISKKISSSSEKDFLDLAEKEDFLELLSSDIIRPTSSLFMGYNFAVSSKEVCFYNAVSSNNVIAVLEALQIDLLLLKRFDLKRFLLLSKQEQIAELDKLKQLLRRQVITTNDAYLLYLFDELYLKNKNINEIITPGNPKERVNQGRIKILTLKK